MSPTTRGRIGWYELMTSDPEAAQDFYGKVVGWNTAPWDGAEQPYTMWMVGDAPLGGVMQLPEEAAKAGAPPHWVAYVTVADADETLARAKELGGTVLWGPMDIPEVGRVAGLADPLGATFAIHEPAGEAPGSDEPPAVGHFSWHELATTDWEAAWDFYSSLFGWENTEDMEMGEIGTYRMFSTGARPVGGMFNKPPELPVSAWWLYARVADIEKALAAVKANGGHVMSGPMEVPGGDMVAQCIDPQGGAFALHMTKN